jgi:hypothetical protein
MDLKDLHLTEISFSAPPTKTQVVNTLRDIFKFINRMGGALILDESYNIGDQAVATMLNGAIQLRAAADAFENGPNATGLAVPQPGPQVVSRRQ